MIVERKLQRWVQHVLATYAAEPRYVEQVFQEEDQVGTPQSVSATGLLDANKLWLPGEWVGGTLRYGGLELPIVSNTVTTLTVTGGDLASVGTPEGRYQIVPEDLARLLTYLSRKPFSVDVSYMRLPVRIPSISLRLQSDVQAAAGIGESVTYGVNPAQFEEVRWFQTEMTATYLMTIATENPQETVWLYNLLMNAFLQAQQRFALWGLADTTVHGMDLHPDVQFLPEQVYSRYIELRGTRLMQAVYFDTIEQVTDVDTVPTPHYAELDSKGDPPAPGPWIRSTRLRP